MYELSEVRTEYASVLHEYVYQLSQHAHVVFCVSTLLHKVGFWNHLQGSYGSWKTWKFLEFYYGISRTGKSWKNATGSGKFWKSAKRN